MTDRSFFLTCERAGEDNFGIPNTDRSFLEVTMPTPTHNLPNGNRLSQGAVIRSSVDLGAVVREQRKHLALKQLDIAGLGNTGNRFIVDLENGKPTVQLQKVLDIIDLLGLEVMVRPKVRRAP
jgi:HTH-type transcriptional regulator / antitoxin HipB